MHCLCSAERLYSLAAESKEVSACDLFSLTHSQGNLHTYDIKRGEEELESWVLFIHEVYVIQ